MPIRPPGRDLSRPPALPNFNINLDDEDEDEDEGVDSLGLRPTHTERLPPATEIDGEGGYTEIDGEEAQHLAGRSSSPRLFYGGAGHPTVTQLKVFKVENGLPVSLGAIDAEATEADLVRTYFASMPKIGDGRIQFRFRPIDADNREMGVESSTWISEDHADLQRLRRARTPDNQPQVQAPYPAPNLGLPSEILGLFSRAIDRSQSSLDEERLRSRQMMEQTANERLGLAQSTVSSIQSMSERMLTSEAHRAQAALEAESNRNKQASDSMAAFFATQIELMSAGKEQELSRLNADREREAERAARDAQREAERAERELSREAQRIERERAEAQRRIEEAKAEAALRLQENDQRINALLKEAERHDMRRQEEFARLRSDEERRYEERREREREERRLEREAAERREKEREREREREREAAERAREREREERRLEAERIREELKHKELMLQRDHEMRLKQMEIEAQQKREYDARLAQLQQLQLQAAMQAAQGARTDLKSLLTEATTVLGALGLEPKDLIQRFLNPPVPETDNTAAWTDLAGKVIGSVGEVARAKLIADATKQKQDKQRQLPNQMAPLPLPAPPIPNMIVPQPQPAAPVFVQAKPQVKVQPAPAPAPAASPAPAPAKIDVPFATQKAARLAIRKLLEQLREAPKEKWENLITANLMNTPAIYTYVQAVSVVTALKEAGANDKFTEEFIDALIENPLVPDDLNLGIGYEDDDDDEDADTAEEDEA